MSHIQRVLRTILFALALAATVIVGAGWSTDAILVAGSSAQPGETDVGFNPTPPAAIVIAGSSAQPGETDVG